MSGHRFCLACGERRPLFSYGPAVARPVTSRSVADRAALLREIEVRRRRALIRARRALAS